MFCPKCGHAVESGDKFCTSCGAPLHEETAQTAPTPTPDFDFSVEQPELQPASPASPSAIRNALTSPAALVALIAFTAAAVFELFSLFYATYDFLCNMDVEFYNISAISIIFPLLSIASSVLIVTGSWMTYASARAGQSKTTGLTMARVALIISMVLMCIVMCVCEYLVLLEVGMISFNVSLQHYFGLDPSLAEAAMMQNILGFLFIAVAAILVLLIIYYVKAYKTVGVMRNTLATGIPSDRIPGFVAVMQFILGGVTVLSALYRGELLTILGGICSAAAAISFGVFLFGYRSKMRALMTGTQNGM